MAPSGILFDEKKLFADIASGDGTAFTTLYTAYSAKLAAYVAHLLNSDLWAEEIVQDVFLKLWANRHMLCDIAHPQGYLYRMAANRTHDHLKRRALEVRLQYRISRLAAGEPKDFTEQLIDFRISERLFNEAVNTLPPQRLLAYRLRHEKGLSYEEIARQLRVSKNTVRNQLVAALDTIRTYLIEHGRLVFFIILNLWFSGKNIF